MSKTAQIKGDLDDVEALLEIISILKDVSTNRFFAFAQRKESFGKFLEQFLVFFSMLQAAETNCPLVRNQIPGTDIVIITSESSFMAQLNSRVCNAALKEYQKYPGSKVVCVGYRVIDKVKQMGMEVEKVYRDIELTGRYEMSLMIRDYLIERIMSGQTGRAICIYVWAKSFNILKPRVVTLLPAEELIVSTEEAEEVQESSDAQTGKKIHTPVKKFIQESSIDGIMKVLADIWISCRLYEILVDTQLAEAASQAQQLESSIEGLSKEKSGLMLSFKKAMRGDLNKAMTEVFTASKVIRRR